jgi:purine-cytosine permease-like protein
MYVHSFDTDVRGETNMTASTVFWSGATAMMVVLVTFGLAAWFGVDVAQAVAQSVPAMLILAILAALTVAMLREEPA